MTLPTWEAVLLFAGAISGPLGGYLLGRLHAHFIQGERDRQRAFSALTGHSDWESRVTEAEAAAVEHTKRGRWYEAKMAMEIALRIRESHKGGS